MSSRTPRIARLNDLLRTAFLGGKVVITQGIAALDDAVREDILLRVRQFEGFTPDNDPYGEHDFGAFVHPVAGKVFWKIDCYDRQLLYGSPDPADPKVTCRVLTIMRAEEY
jgi:hypothetical protein